MKAIYHLFLLACAILILASVFYMKGIHDSWKQFGVFMINRSLIYAFFVIDVVTLLWTGFTIAESIDRERVWWIVFCDLISLAVVALSYFIQFRT